MSVPSVKAYAPRVTLIQATPSPNTLVCAAASQTMRQFVSVDDWQDGASPTLVRYLLLAGHTSVLEHALVTLHIEDISRSCSLELVRHRHASFTSSSQRYQNYAAYPTFVSPTMAEDPRVVGHIQAAYALYESLLADGVPSEDARQVLPEACGVNMVVTMNARALVNFLNVRRCHRAAREMRLLAGAIDIVVRGWFPELFDFVGPDCAMPWGCRQGRMSCVALVRDAAEALGDSKVTFGGPHHD